MAIVIARGRNPIVQAAFAALRKDEAKEARAARGKKKPEPAVEPAPAPRKKRKPAR